MSKSADYYNERSYHFLYQDCVVSPLDLLKIEEKCKKNKTKTCFYVIEGIRTKIFMDDKTQFWVYSEWNIQGKPDTDKYVKIKVEGNDDEDEEFVRTVSVKKIYEAEVEPPDMSVYASKEKEEEVESEEEEEYEYGAYSLEKMFKARICVGGGGLMNGNANAYIEGEWKTEDDFNDGEPGEIFYCEYGGNPVKRFVGTRIVWGEDDKFNVE